MYKRKLVFLFTGAPPETCFGGAIFIKKTYLTLKLNCTYILSFEKNVVIF